ncbi:protein polyglycylase TTLL10 [Trichomycterus rosablanca]|uniref:protein polyglycylase TTLL10 n=1 Tax=Trichomycterus rosablanca TaxID=2290929 RepID=UPI002F360AFA
MSSGRWVQPGQRSQKAPGNEHVCIDSPKAVGEDGEAEDENQNHLPAAVQGKGGTLEPVGEDKQQRKKEEQKTHGRVQGAPGTNREKVKQSGGNAPDSECLVECFPSMNKSGGLKKQRGTQQVLTQQGNRNKCPEDSRGAGQFFFFGGGNGASIVVPYCESKGWRRITDKTREDYKLNWCELKCFRTYHNFREGEQLIYQIPNNKVLTTKIRLLNSLRVYDRISSKVNHGREFRRLKMEEFFPETFRMDIKDERETFFNQYEEFCSDKGNMWICKPTGLNQGRGIFLLRMPEEMSALKTRMQLLSDNNTNKRMRRPQAYVVQQYIQNPLLLKGKKFDVRSYFLIACTSPYMVFFRHGYVRLTCDLYDPISSNLTAHLTNQYMQKKNPLYSIVKEETVWSMEHFNEYVNENFMGPRGLPEDWVLGVFTKRMQQIIIHCFLAVKSKLECKLGYFDLIGCDFLIDENFKVWLLEMNCNPALHTNCEVLKEVVPKTVTETLDLTIEIFNKCRCGMKLLPLSSQKDFILLYNGETVNSSVTKQRSRTALPTRTPGSKSTSKKMHQAVGITPHEDNSGNSLVSISPGISNHASPPVLQTIQPRELISTSSDNEQYVLPGCRTVLATPANKTSGIYQKTLATKPAEVSHMHRNKTAPKRVELRLGNCTWQHFELTSKFTSPELKRAKSTIVSSSSTTLNDHSSSFHRLRVREEGHSTSVKFPEMHLAQSPS